MLQTYRMGKPFRWVRLLTLLALLMPLAGWGQTFYALSGGDYSQNFADITNWTNNFASGSGAQNYRTAASVTTSSVTQPTVFTTTTSGGVQKGSGNIVLLATGTATPSNSAAFDLLLDFSGRTAGTLTFDYAKIANTTNASPRKQTLKVQYSLDNGVTFTDFTGYILPVVNNNSTTESGSVSIALPTGLDNEAQVVVRFFASPNGDNTGSGNRPKISIDNIAVTSTASSTPATCAAPGTPSFSGTTSTSTTVSFTPNSTNVGPYTVTAVPTSGTTVTATGAGSPISLTGLTASTSYSVTVTGICTAATGGGTSPASTAATATTSAAPCTAPTSVTAGSISTTAASIAFTGNATATGGYTVNYTAAGGTAQTQTGTASPIALSGLTPNTTYSVTVSSNCGGTTTATSTPAITFDTQADAPTLTSINPTSIPAGQTTTVTFIGTNFINGATVSFNGATVAATVTGPTTLTADLTAPASTTTATFPVFVTTTAGNSGSQTLTVTGSPTGFYEPFELGTKGAYTSGSVTLATGSYTFDDALLGTSNSDLKNGNKSARIRQGSVTMNFDKTTGAGTITLLAGNYVGDSNGRLVVSVSNGGTTAYTAFVSPTTALTGNTLQTYTFTVNIAGPVRVRISNAATSGRISVDDLQISDYTAPVACGAPGAPTFSNITQTSADVTVAPGANGTGPFTVTATPTAGGTAITASGASPVSLTGLTAGTSYSVAVTSDCNAGFSSPSQASTAVTLTTAAAPTAQLSVRRGNTGYPSNGTAYSFGNQTLATASAPVSFTLANNGTGALTISGISTTGDFAVSGATPTTIAAGDTAVVSVTFTPTATGTRNGTLVISSNAAAGATYTVNLTGNGTAVPAPEIDVLQGTTAYASGSTYSGFPATTVGGFSPASFTVQNTGSAPLTISSLAATGNFTASGPGTPFTIAVGGSATVSAVFAPTAAGTRTGSITIFSNDSDEATYVINLSGNAILPDLVVSNTQTVSGSYNNVTITSTGKATLGGNLTVNGTLTVDGWLASDPNGSSCPVVDGPGSFLLNAGGRIEICDAAGITTSGSTGFIRVAGTRTFNSDAIYFYTSRFAQVTGNGLPARIRFLSVGNGLNGNPGGVTLSQDLSMSSQARLFDCNLITNGYNFTLLSTATDRGYVTNSGTATGGVVVGAATVQRYIDSSNPIGYRHYSAPVSNNTVNDLSATGFSPVFNPAYNTSPTPSTVTPFPTVFGYDENRISTVTSTYGAFDRGWFSPASGDAMAVGRGYTANAPNTALVDFVGTLNNGNVNSGTLSRGASSEAGWQLLGNPYPEALDWSTVAPAQRPGVDAAMYVFQSSGQYGGTYRSYANGVAVPNIANAGLIGIATGYFVRVSTPNTTGAVNLTNSNRARTGLGTAFGLTTADTRPQLQLQVQGNGAADDLAIYFEAGASAGVDAEYDATKLANPSGLNLASLAGSQELAINGLPVLGNAAVLVPLTVRVPQAGSYRFEAANLANLTGTATLVDALTSTRTVLATGTSYAFAMAGTSATGRFSVEFRQSGVLATTAAQALSAQVQLFPNPASSSFRLQLPMLSSKAAVSATLVNALGQTVLNRSLSAPAGQAIDAAFDVRGLAAGVYTLRLNVDGTSLVRKVVVE
jgi:hypothetical protein